MTFYKTKNHEENKTCFDEKLVLTNTESLYGNHCDTINALVNRELNNFEQAQKVFDEELRDFNKAEEDAYSTSVQKLYKPIGVNIFEEI